MYNCAEESQEDNILNKKLKKMTEKNGPTLHQMLGHLFSDIRKDHNKLIEIYRNFWKTSEDKTF